VIRSLVRRLSRRKRPLAVLTARDLPLLEWTGQDSVAWVSEIQDAIAAGFTESDDPNHPNSDALEWMSEILWKICRCVQPAPGKDEPRYDTNIRAASIATLVLATWTSRIRHAKAYDPNRPLGLRRQALDAHAHFVDALIDAAINETRDDELFPTQEWNPPYGRSARGGTFV